MSIQWLLSGQMSEYDVEMSVVLRINVCSLTEKCLQCDREASAE